MALFFKHNYYLLNKINKIQFFLYINYLYKVEIVYIKEELHQSIFFIYKLFIQSRNSLYKGRIAPINFLYKGRIAPINFYIYI
jgi:hypothetical protein